MSDTGSFGGATACGGAVSVAFEGRKLELGVRLADDMRPTDAFSLVLNLVSFILVIIYISKDSSNESRVYQSPVANTYITNPESNPQVKYLDGFVVWAGIDHSVSNPVPITYMSPLPALDSSATIYPAAELHGSVYLPEGNVVISDGGDVFLGAHTSMTGMASAILALQCTACKLPVPCCPQNAELSVIFCNCSCMTGYSGVDCDQRICYNNGTWNSATQTCSCPFPYTPDSMCARIDCGLHGVVIGDVCVCIAPYSGIGCTILDTTPVVEITPPCWNISANCTSRSNWGIGQCVSATTCVCPPLYYTPTDAILRQLDCQTNCSDYFALIAPLCCTGTVNCEQLQRTTNACSTQMCCNSRATADQCLSVQGCYWGFKRGCTYNTVAAAAGAVVWTKEVIDCDLSDNGLCNTDVAMEQMAIYHAAPTFAQAYTNTIQTMAWIQISQYDIWQDDLSHSIVLFIPEITPPVSNIEVCTTTFRLTLAYDSHGISNTFWSCGGTNAAQTSFTFELVEDMPEVAPSLLGAVYRVWVAGTMWCLMDRSLYQDELVMYSFTPYTNNSVVAIDVATPGLYTSKTICGLFFIQDRALIAIRSSLSLNNNGARAVVWTQAAPLISTPPLYIDSNPYMPVFLPSTITCRYLPCRVDFLRGVCQSPSCLAQWLPPALVQACLPCLEAHVFLGALQ